ncbi:hypothetical protein DFH08DRAFT_1087178 [Mycena albidolilacea]|uniref:Uncharacterized protein n=1 Tax=Mycena albidolilacea TaxID=1033008 RepID=A0AAD6ZAE6_9AGAR|nr:hypothetical protein DFH08DRAFT_1087178 [Mycena albidolilacea]
MPSPCLPLHHSDHFKSLRADLMAVHVFGILGTTDIRANQDRWMAFRAAGVDDGELVTVVGDPNSERLELASTPVTILPLSTLKTRFLHALSHADVQEEDSVVIALDRWSLFAASDSFPNLPRLSIQDAHHFMESIKAAMEGTFNDANFVIHSLSTLPSELPLRPFTPAYFSHLRIVDSSTCSSMPVNFDADGPEAAVAAVRSNSNDIRPLAAEEEAELKSLAGQYTATLHPNMSIDVAVNLMAAQVAHGAPLESKAQERILLENSKAAVPRPRFSTGICHCGTPWTGSRGFCGARGNGLKETMEAEAHGAVIVSEFFLGTGAMEDDGARRIVGERLNSGGAADIGG